MEIIQRLVLIPERLLIGCADRIHLRLYTRKGLRTGCDSCHGNRLFLIVLIQCAELTILSRIECPDLLQHSVTVCFCRVELIFQIFQLRQG